MYFDSAATTPLDPRVKEEMLSVMDIFGNENSKHCYGFEARKKMDGYLRRIADVLNVSPDQLAITYSGTDSNRKIIWACRKRFGYENLYCSSVEHSSISDEILEENCFDPRDFSGVPESAKFLALMHANSETGAVYEGEELRKKFPDAVLLRDYAQSFAKGLLPDFGNCDGGTFAPQKIYGPKMVGLLYLKNPEFFTEISKDSHTKNLFLVAGMAKAFEIHAEELSKKIVQIGKWQQQIEGFIDANIPDYKIHEKEKPRIPGLINVAFKGARGSELMAILSEREGIAISTGSACTSDILSPTRVIKFIEQDETWRYSIRIGLHKFLSDENVRDFCEILEHYIEEIRKKNY